jgi:hypothetical protein
MRHKSLWTSRLRHTAIAGIETDVTSLKARHSANAPSVGMKELHMYRTIDTVHEYRLRYPHTAPVPTLTQSGLLGLLLDAQARKAAKLARRRAMWKRISNIPRDTCNFIWRGLIPPQSAGPLPHVEASAR